MKHKRTKQIYKAGLKRLKSYGIDFKGSIRMMAVEFAKLDGKRLNLCNMSKADVYDFVESFIPYAAYDGPAKHKKKKQQNRRGKSDLFYKSREWRELRYKALAKYGRRCLCCGATPEDGIVLHVDHIKPRATHRHLELDLNNLQVLCADCNIGKNYYDDTDFRHMQQHMDDITKH